MIPIIIAVIAFIVAIGSVYITHQDGNPVEKVAEEVIEEELDLPAGSINLDQKK